MKAKPLPPHRSFFKPLLIVFLFMGFEVVARIVLSFNVRGLETTRKLLSAEIAPSPTFQLCVGQPYLLYIPTPNFRDKQGFQHNSQGYRGLPVKMRKTPGRARVLCLGGSTTYGWGVERPDQAYPAYLEKILNQNRPHGISGVEVLNGGIPSGTTAEILTHYHFKFHFYQPDIVVINPGGNDARALAAPYYHPDYSHTRKQIEIFKPLPPLGRKVLKSRFAALLLIPLIYGPHPNAAGFYSYDGLPPVAPWYELPSPQKGRHPQEIPLHEVAFKHNLDLLLDEIKKDGGKVLLVPFRSSPIVPYQPLDGLAIEERILEEMARERNILRAPFPADVISRNNWIDDCHANAEGNFEKANYIAPFVIQLLKAL